VPLSDRIQVIRRFQRSVRIDADIDDLAALDGFICPASSLDVLQSMARHLKETGHAAFTWTGPYGSGKSSLVVALSALLSGTQSLRRKATNVIGAKAAKEIASAFPCGAKGWRILPVVGRRDDPARVIGEALHANGFLKSGRRKPSNGEAVQRTLLELATSNPRSHGGLILFIDEMGKFLEGAAQQGSDIYLFQQLAEAASRSRGRFVLVGVLHQAFEEYAHRLSREMRDEWAKIQGRFIDLAVNTAGEEQIELLARAIESERRLAKPGPIAKAIADEVRRNRPAVSQKFALRLEECWPLHSVVACLLGPLSRRRFGQNQRSIFGFLNSAEPHGFQEFLAQASNGDIYSPHRLWDYLRANLEPSILASPDGHRWALAVEAIERCEAVGGDQIHLDLLKTIALIDLFKERSGLVPSIPVLAACHPDHSRPKLGKVLERLQQWSFIVYRRFADAYAIYAGSDFDIEQAVRSALENTREADLNTVRRLAGLQPVLAKRHYHETGAMRWFDLEFSSLNDLAASVEQYIPQKGAIGCFILAVPNQAESQVDAERLCREAARKAQDADIIVGLSHRSWVITDLARELTALEQVRDERPELAGDAVARREVNGRLTALQAQLESELQRAMDSATWFLKHHSPKRWLQAELNSVASDLADKRFNKGPRLHNELLNRIKPSSNAIAAQNTLLRLMVLNEGQSRLGIDGFPAEGGLFASMLEGTGLYVQTRNGWSFVAPNATVNDDNNLAPLWDAASDFLKRNNTRTVLLSEIYDIWRRVPYGVKDGLMPVLAAAFILSTREIIAFYREGIFQARFKELDAEFLVRDAKDVQLRWLDLSELSRRLLSDMADIVRELDEQNRLTHLTPIDVARGLIDIYDRLHNWTKRTARLSANAVRVRTLFKHASDPNKFLFDDIPGALRGGASSLDAKTLHQIVREVRDGLQELQHIYPAMLHRFQDNMLAELQVPNASPQALAELRDRAENIKQLAGDFRLDAFAGRISLFTGTDSDIEGLASLAADKPPRDWTDPDLDRAAVELAELCQRFLRAETFARVKGRPDKRHAMAVVVGMNGRPAPLLEEFEIGDSDRIAVNDLIAQVSIALETADPGKKNIILAALAELSARYMRDSASFVLKERVVS
jgi:hypothetical protein